MAKNIKKHNSLTDARTGKLSLRGDKLINALYLLYEKDGENIEITITELRELLNLKGGDYGKDIELRLQELRDSSIKFRNVKLSHGDYLYFVDSFIQSFGIDRGSQNYCKIKISESFIEAFSQKMGYTPIDLEICNKFKTKYGLKLYEMYLRYYSLPNKQGEGIGTISLTIQDLNEMFGTAYTTPSEIKRGIERGLKEIEKITKEFINVFYHKGKRKFVFSWHQKRKYPNLRVPYNHIDILIDWYLHHNEDKLKIKSLTKYKQSLKKSIIDDEFKELDKYYRGLLQWKYDVEWSKYYDLATGIYRNFEDNKGKV